MQFSDYFFMPLDEIRDEDLVEQAAANLFVSRRVEANTHNTPVVNYSKGFLSVFF